MADSNLTTEQISLMLKNKELFYQEKDGKSEVWQNFDDIVNQDGQSVGFVSCKSCYRILKYDYKSGTSSLKRHKCPADEKQQKITSFWGKKAPPTAAKEATTKKIINLVCKDLRPFEIILGEGFREFSQEMINIGSTYGALSVNELFPHPTTISRNIIKNAESVKTALALKLKNAFQFFGGAFTTDMWTDDYRKLSYISLTVHYIDENWQLKEQILTASRFPDVRHTSEQIKKVVLGILKSYNLVPDTTMKRYAFVTDSGANFVAAFRGLNHIPCFAHKINTILGSAFQDTNFENSPSIINTLKECKSLVTYFKQSSLNSKLDKSLKQETETRWNSKLDMLESINEQFESITNLLSERDEIGRIENIDTSVLQTLISFLRKFREASEFLEGSKYPTLHMVIPWYKALMDHCKVNISDNDILIQIKSVVELKMKSKIKIEDLHKLAVFFDPRMKQLKILEQSDVIWVKTKIKNQCSNLLSQYNDSDGSDDSVNTVQERPTKRPRKKIKESTDFSQFYDSSSSEGEEDEVDQYIKSKVPKDRNLDILQWWKDHKLEYPKLAILCAYYLSIPASSASSEREFSAAGQTISERRTNLNPETIDSVLIMHSMLK